MNDSTLWWIAAGLLVAAELMTGTFYLLMLALGAVAGAVAALAGASPSLQIVAAALLGGGAAAVWHWYRPHSRRGTQTSDDSQVGLEIGQTVHVTAWLEDGTTRVKYRGAQWSARLQDQSYPSPLPGTFRISGVDGSQLLLEKI